MLTGSDGRCVGLCQLLHYSLPFIGGVTRVNGGPVYASATDESASPVPASDLLEALSHYLATRRFWKVDWLPNLEHGEPANDLMSRLGCTRVGRGWSSALLAIDHHVDALRAHLHGKWRNLLKKSEKQGVELELADASEGLAFVLPRYEAFQRDKGFQGHSKKLLHAMLGTDGQAWDPRIMFARHDGDRVGGIMVVGHGDTATYLLGWTPEAGRRLNSNYFLLWQALLYFRSKGFRYLDVGGLGENTPNGIAHFKKGLKGEDDALAGKFCTGWRWPFGKRGRVHGV